MRPEGNLDLETFGIGLFSGVVVDPGFDTLLRRNTLNLTTPSGQLLTGYGYDTASRLQTVSSGVFSATYGRIPNSELIGTLSATNDGAAVINTTKSYDKLNRLDSTVSRNAANAVVSSVGYRSNLANQREQATTEDGSYWQYGYDSLGQVIRGKRFWGDNSEVIGEQFGYRFDDIGNRRTAVVNGRESRYTTNPLNQYITRTVPGAVDVLGKAALGSTVSVNGAPVSRQGEFFANTTEIDNTANAYAGTVNVVGVKKNAGPGGTDLVAEDNRPIFVPSTPETFTFDLDGNLTLDGRWNYTWDGENRLVRMETRSGLPSSVQRQKLVFTYDYAGRRIQKRVYAFTTGAWVLNSETRFIYDGWNLLAELDGGNLVQRSYTWGLDLNGSEQGAGGVGGLLFITLNAQPATPTLTTTFGGNGDISRLIKMADSTVRAEYEYGPFGEPLRATGALAESNPFRFSTKSQDTETGLLYYGYRYCQLQSGCWLSRDPIEEEGGLNLYGYVGNDPVNEVDPLGLFTAVIVGGPTASGASGDMKIVKLLQGRRAVGDRCKVSRSEQRKVGKVGSKMGSLKGKV